VKFSPPLFINQKTPVASHYKNNSPQKEVIIDATGVVIFVGHRTAPNWFWLFFSIYGDFDLAQTKK
jgi:hypothetical protein